MNKYWRLFLISWQNGTVYRVNLFFWRFRQLISTILSMTLWTVIFSDEKFVFGYSRDLMITYIFIISILQSVIIATVHQGLSGTVYSGSISKELVKPINLFLYLGVQDLSEKIKNLLFVMLETLVIYLIFKPILFFPSIQIFEIFILWTLGGIILNFWINLLMGAIGFWSPDSWGTRFLFFMIMEISAGKLFPLDILPSVLKSIFAYTPFTYMSYYQTQLFLGRINQNLVWNHSLILGFFIIIFGAITFWIWNRGFRLYSASGQ